MTKLPFLFIFKSRMVDVAQGLESQIVDLGVAGSNPVIHPNHTAPVAHLDRVTDFESVGSRFESCRARTKNTVDF